MDDNSTVTEAVEVVTAPDASNQGMVVIELENTIKSHLSSIDNLEAEYSKHRDMLEDIFNNDTTYKEHAKVAKEAARIKKFLAQLPQTYRIVIELRFFQDLNANEIAKIINKRAGTVRVIQLRALAKLKELLQTHD